MNSRPDKSNDTEQKHSVELTLQEYSALVKQSPIMIWRADLSMGCDYFNESWLKFTGRTLEQELGNGWSNGVHPEDFLRCVDFYQSAFTKREVFEMEYRLKRHDGAWRWIFDRGCPFYNERGEFAGYIGSCIDVDDRRKAQEALQKSEAYLTEAERLNHTGSWAYDVVCRVSTYWSAERCRISGFDPAKGIPLLDNEQATHTAESWANRNEAIARAMREKTDFQTDSCLVFPDGSKKHLHIVGHPVLNSAGEVVELFGTTTDVTATRQAGLLLSGEKRLLEMIAKGDSLSAVLTELCRLFEELCDGSFAAILLLDSDTKLIRHGAGPNLPQKFIEAFKGSAICPLAGSFGTVTDSSRSVIVSDIANDPLWADSRDVALAHRLRICWSTPILSSQNCVLGVFAIYFPEPRSPDSQQQAVIVRITHLASIALERKRTEETLRRSEAYLAEAQKLSRTGSFGWNVSTGEIIWSKETYCIFQYDPGQKPTLELVFKRIDPRDIAFVQQTLDRVTRDELDLDFEHRLLMPDGLVKHLHVVARPAKTESGEIEFVGAVMDVTERKQSQEVMRAAKARFCTTMDIASRRR